jgi:cellulose synthase/poly-beta-1,6-N-acetylglucosamine synthase-like glycosyltransferase
MLGEWVLAGLGARSWGFDIVFLLLGFSGVLLLLLLLLFFFFFFFYVVSFLYTSCMLRGAFYAFLMLLCLLPIKKKKSRFYVEAKSFKLICEEGISVAQVFERSRCPVYSVPLGCDDCWRPWKLCF